MKKALKILLPILVIALLVGSLCVFAFAQMAEDGITATFYDGDKEVGVVTVASGGTPAAPDTDEITVIDGIGYRLLGWTDVQGGTEPKALASITEDTSYYAVREAAAFKVVHADETVTWYAPNSDESLDPAVRAGKTFVNLFGKVATGDTVIACMDFDIVSDVGLTKSVTLDLGGNTVTTTARIEPSAAARLVVCNGVVDITVMEMVYMETADLANSCYTEFKNITAKNTSETSDKYVVEVRSGEVVFDNVTINEGEWIIDDAKSSQSVISAGYRTKVASQRIGVTVKNSNINATGCSLFRSGGASKETNGYSIDLDIIDSNINVTYCIACVEPASTAVANCAFDLYITGESVVLAGSNPTLSINKNMDPAKVNVLVDYGVYLSRVPKPSVGTVKLGADGDGLLANRDSGNWEGEVVDLWVDDYTPVTDSAYTFCVQGDPQYIVQSYPDKLPLINDWILANKDSKNIQYVFSMGDTTNHDTAVEWERALAELSRLNGVIPYSVVRGNHDGSAGYNAAFNNEAYKAMFDGFYSESTLENSYATFTVGEVKYLHITLDYMASDSILAWAGNLIEKYYDHRVIISTHAYLAYDGTLLTSSAGTTGSTNNGQQMWDKLIRKHENIFLVLSGHVSAIELGYSQMVGDNGNVVTQIMTDGQTLDRKNGAMGLISMLHFSEDGKTLSVEYYSTVYGRYLGKNSQITLTVPEYTVSEPETPDYLYAVTDLSGNTVYYTAETPFSTVIAAIDSPSTLTLYGDATIDATPTLVKNLVINLNGHTLSTDGGRINTSKINLTIFGGTVALTKNEFIYVDAAHTTSKIFITDVTVTRAEGCTSNFLHVRGGSATLDNVRATADKWLADGILVSSGQRTASQSLAINVTIKNSSLDFGTTASNLVNFGGMSGETRGYTANVTIINTSVTTAGKILKLYPQSGAAANCGANISFEGNTVINCATPFEFRSGIPTESISISFAEGVTLYHLPVVSGVTVNYGGVLVYDPSAQTFTVTLVENVDPAVCGCKMVDADGNAVLYWKGTSLTKELVAKAQSIECDIVLLGDMAMPAGVNQDNRYSISITGRNLTIDLGGHTLTMPNWTYWGTVAESTKLTINNGTIVHGYNVYYSHSGTEGVTAFEANDVAFERTRTALSFDVRKGDLILRRCSFTFNSSATQSDIAAFGNGTDSSKLNFYMEDCTIHLTTAGQNIFKTYCGRPLNAVITDCDLSTTTGYIYYAQNSKGKNPKDTILFKNTTLSKTGEGLLFNVCYETVTITFDEVYVPSGSTCEPAMGTLLYAEGQTRATVSGGGYKITVPKLSISANLTLYSDFNLNLYLGNNAARVMVGDTELTLEEYNAEQVKAALKGIAPNTAADTVVFTITYTDEGETYTVQFSYSVARYATSLLAGEYSDAAKALVANAVKYIDAAYAVADAEKPAELTALIASEGYTAALENASNVAKDGITASNNYSALAVAIDSAQLRLSDNYRYVLNLNESFTGTLKINNVSYNVVGGAVNGKTYVTVNLRGYEFNDGLTVSATTAEGTVQGTYTLADYVTAMVSDGQENTALDNLLVALYNFTVEAKEYKAYADTNGLN